MAKASLRLPNGTNVQIDGTPEEIRALLSFYGGADAKEPPSPQSRRNRAPGGTGAASAAPGKGVEPDLMAIVRSVKSCAESEAIEKRILDHNSALDRTLLPYYIVHRYLGDAFGFTSGDVSTVTKELGVPMATSNVTNTLAGPASRYLIGDKQRKQGVPVRYKLSRKGMKYLESVIAGEVHTDTRTTRNTPAERK